MSGRSSSSKRRLLTGSSIFVLACLFSAGLSWGAPPPSRVVPRPASAVCRTPISAAQELLATERRDVTAGKVALPIDPKSFAASFPRMLPDLEAVEQMMPLRTNDFIERFRKSQNRSPFTRDAVQAVLLKRNAMETKLRDMMNAYSSSPMAKEFESLAERMKEDSQLLAGYLQMPSGEYFDLLELPLTPHSRGSEIYERGTKELVGALGELEPMARLPDIRRRGMYLVGDVNSTNHTERNFDRIVQERFESLQRDHIGVQAQTAEQFPLIFNDRDGVRRSFEQVKTWIASKEMDLVQDLASDRNSPWKAAWIEVKAYPLIDESTLRHTRSDGKSLLDQIQEDQQIIEFLGLRTQVKLKFFNRRGVTQGVKRLLNQLEVEVLGEVK